MFHHAGHMGGFHASEVIFWIIIILVILAVFNILKDNTKLFKRSESEALEILKNKFANGDISKEEYLSKKSVLNQ